MVPCGKCGDSPAARIVTAVLAALAPAPGASVLALLSGPGGMPEAELYLAYGAEQAARPTAGFPPQRCLVGNLVTSLGKQGVALTLLALNAEMIALWDGPVQTQALRWGM